jgi:hypothetical protein
MLPTAGREFTKRTSVSVSSTFALSSASLENNPAPPAPPAERDDKYKRLCSLEEDLRVRLAAVQRKKQAHLLVLRRVEEHAFVNEGGPQEGDNDDVTASIRGVPAPFEELGSRLQLDADGGGLRLDANEGRYVSSPDVRLNRQDGVTPVQIAVLESNLAHWEDESDGNKKFTISLQ